MSGKRWRLVVAAVVVLGTLGGAAALRAADTNPQPVAVPAAGGTTILHWSGTIPVNANPASDCTSLPDTPTWTDDEIADVQAPAAGYTGLKTTFTFEITWKPANPTQDETLNDEILTVVSQNGDEGDTS